MTTLYDADFYGWIQAQAKWLKARNWEQLDTENLKDLQVKRPIYARAGIPEYWVVNLRERSLVVMRSPTDGDYSSQVTLTSGTLQPLASPDLSLAVEPLLP
ncbi:MAG: DUF29 family protein [Synechococcales bacterium]|nr:DUF29 family protein [Synechococcales bacterium]